MLESPAGIPYDACSMRPDQLPGTQGLDSKTSHAKVWLTAVLVAGAVTGLAYMLFAGFEREPWFPRALARFLNKNEAAVFAGGAVVLAFVIALVLYARKTFTRSTTAEDGWGQGMSLEPAATTTTSPGETRAPAGSGFGAGEDARQYIPVVLRNKRRACHGDLVLTERRFYFICYRDESLAKTVGGRAVAQQFGLLGALVHAFLSGSSRKRKQSQLEQTRREYESLSLEAQAEQNEYSLRFEPREITLFAHSGMQGARFEARGEKYAFIEIQKNELAAIKTWCERHQVPTKGL